jgi:hypothetical protein
MPQIEPNASAARKNRPAPPGGCEERIDRGLGAPSAPALTAVTTTSTVATTSRIHRAGETPVRTFVGVTERTAPNVREQTGMARRPSDPVCASAAVGNRGDERCMVCSLVTACRGERGDGPVEALAAEVAGDRHGSPVRVRLRGASPHAP